MNAEELSRRAGLPLEVAEYLLAKLVAKSSEDMAAEFIRRADVELLNRQWAKPAKGE